MTRNYQVPNVSADWANSRETHMAIATAIHAVSDSHRSPEAIWEDPTSPEWDHVLMAVEEYLANGDFPAEPDGRYSWGQETLKFPVEA